MNTEATYLKETDRYDNVLWEVVVCAACLAQHLLTFPAMGRASAAEHVDDEARWTGEGER